MPKLTKSPMQKAAARLTGLIRMHQDEENISDTSMAKLIRPGTKEKPGMHVKTYQDKLRDPGTFTVRELAVAVRRLHMSEEELLGVIRLVLKEG